MASLNEMLGQLVETGGQSLQFLPDAAPFVIRGEERLPVGDAPLTGRSLHALLGHVLDHESRQTLQLQSKVDGLFEVAGVGAFTFRVAMLELGLAVAFRLDPNAPPPPPPGPPPWPTDDIHTLMKAVVERGGSDLILSSGRPARVRIGGVYRAVEGAVFDDAQILGALGDTLTPERRALLHETGNLDVASELHNEEGRRFRFRVNVFHHSEGLGAAYRPIWDTVPDFGTLNLPEAVRGLAEFPYGLVLVTGPTGSGKSTTLSALLEHINATQQRHIITLEDPIEYVFEDKRSLVHQREVGVHVETFAKGLRAALREAPDVILVGEMRDLDTIAAAMTAAETGHLVLSTLHSGSAAQAMDRIIDVFPEHQQSQIRIQLADVTRAIVTQRLMTTIDSDERVPVIELVMVNYAISNLIRDRRLHQLPSAIQTGRADGMIPFDQSLAEWVRAGKVHWEDALRTARDPKVVQALLDDTSRG
jgi:twitching motility protein PilT